MTKSVNAHGVVFKSVRLSALKASGYNPRTITAAARKRLSVSLNRFGMVEAIVVNRRGGALRVVSGHQRLDLLSERGDRECHCAVVDLSDEDEKALNLTLNNPAVGGEFTGGAAELAAEIIAKMSGATELGIEELLERAEKATAKLTEHPVLKPPKLIWSLIAVPASDLHRIHDLLETAAKIPGAICETGATS